MKTLQSVKALHIITGLGVGGAEQQLRLLLRHMPMQCDVLTLTNPGPVAEGLRADGVRVVHLGMRGNRDLGALPRLVKFIRRGQYDLVHTHLYRACVYGRLAARLAGTGATVATEHSLGDGEIEGRPLSGGVRTLYLASERLGAGPRGRGRPRGRPRLGGGGAGPRGAPGTDGVAARRLSGAA
ncbi:glycosyltransferase, partial [Streptomyces sp. NPDC059558]|uniref:glycosyltransferase n=1 Tax=Streptomyces sp. NPDC059558 TaxID=3346864 RepID=UPI0036C328E8